MAILGENHPLRENFQILLTFNRGHRLTFFPEFHADLSRYKEKRVHCTRYKNMHLLPPFCTPFAQGVKVVTREIRFRPTSPVKLCLDPLRFAGVIRSYLYYAIMHMHDCVQQTTGSNYY